ncbi:YqaJ viral recombinase family protein [Methanobrevibacter sp.]|uniref:YqaJ viral recombinase family protein n=1 Tax=Methanobrevibacter sp. TaxID=66852 RepID=UPI00388F9E4E
MQESVSQDRDKFIGGSDIPIIMELSPFKSRFDLLLEKAGYKKNDFEGNVFTEYGNTMESKIRDHINSGLISTFAEGKHIMDVPKDWNEHPNGMRIRCHTDGEIKDAILEIKTTAQIFDSLDDYQIYLVQILFYMAMTGKETGLLAVYKRPDDMDETFNADNLQIWEIHMTDHHALLNDIKNAVSRFLDDLQKVKSNPFITEDELLPAEIPEITKRIIAFEQQVSRMKELEKKIKAEKDRLKQAMETAGVKKWETPNGYKITLIPDAEDKAVTDEFFNAEKFMAEHPELVEQYMETKTSIKKGTKGYVRITAPKEDK